MSRQPAHLGPVRLRNPVMIASGCGGTGPELTPYLDLRTLGGFVTRTVGLDPDPDPGRDRTRIAEAPAGLIARDHRDPRGLQHFLRSDLPWLAGAGSRVFVSVAAANPEDLYELTHRLAQAPGVAGVEVRLGEGEPAEIGRATAVVRDALAPGMCLVAKLEAPVESLRACAKEAARAGADTLVVGNGLPASMPDGEPARLIGPSVLPHTLRAVRTAASAGTGVPVVGAGGVRTTADLRAVLAAGAEAVQVGSAMLHDPTTAQRLIDGWEGRSDDLD